MLDDSQAVSDCLRASEMLVRSQGDFPRGDNCGSNAFVNVSISIGGDTDTDARDKFIDVTAS